MKKDWHAEPFRTMVALGESTTAGGWSTSPERCWVSVLGALIGAGLSLRHLYLQGLPEDQVPSCGPGLDYLMDVFPMTEVIEMVLSGDGSCAEVVWTFLGLSIPGWTLIGFAGLLLVGGFQVLRQIRD